MPGEYHRQILKPAQATDEGLARLRRGLESAVKVQQRLAAQSPHILHFLGKLEEHEDYFFVRHEPANPIDVSSLYDPAAPLPKEKTLLQWSAALADALRVAHDSQTGKASIHGGINCGALLQTPEGIEKLSDFGFAPAICAALGVESYLELAIGPPPSAEEHGEVTACWQTLSPEVDDRDDRICGFIDPDKYGSGIHDAFEAGSDIIAMGIALHLMAEHRHPYLTDPEDHRIREIAAESMGWSVYNGARRQDLRESTDPAVRQWCELVQLMLSRAPADRPTSEKIAEQLAQVNVRPVDATALICRKVEAASRDAQQGDWGSVHDALMGVENNEKLPAETLQKARTLLAQAQAAKSIAEAELLLDSPDWQRIETVLAEIGQVDLPDTLAHQRAALSQKIETNVQHLHQLEKTQGIVGEGTQSDPVHAVHVLQEQRSQLDTILQDISLVPAIRTRAEELSAELEKRSETLASRVDEAHADHEVVNRWFEHLHKSWSAEQWEQMEGFLGDRPDSKYWPKAVTVETESLEKRFAKVQTVLQWAKRFHAPLEQNDLRTLDQLLEDRPTLDEAPAGVRRLVDDLTNRVEQVRSDAEDEAKAREWISRVENAIEKVDWTAARECLLAKPAVAHWPENIAAREREAREKVDAQLAEQERTRLAVESWLADAGRLADKEQWEEALAQLGQPPVDGKQIPKELRTQIKKRAQQWKAARADAQKRKHERLKERVFDQVSNLVKLAIEKSVVGLIDPSAIRVEIPELAWDSDDEPTLGEGRFAVSVTDANKNAIADTLEYALRVGVEGNKLRVHDKPGTEDKLAKELVTSLQARQREQVENWLASLSEGLFPDAHLKWELSQPAARIPITLFMLGPKNAKQVVKTELVWNSKTLDWQVSDSAAVSQTLRATAAEETRNQIASVLHAGTQLFQAYESVIELAPGDPKFEEANGIPTVVTFKIEATLRPKSERELVLPLGSFQVAARKIGHAQVHGDVRPLESSLHRAVVEAQESSRRSLDTKLRQDIRAARAKVKLHPHLNRVTTPVEGLKFSLRSKGQEPIEVASPWSVDEFRFRWSKEVETQIADLIADALPAGSGAKKGAFALVGVAVLVAAAFGIQAALTQDDGNQGKVAVKPVDPPPSLPLNGDHTENGTTRNVDAPLDPNNNPTTTDQPSPSHRASVATAIGEALQIVQSFVPLGDATAETISLAADESALPPRITYRIPGLAQSPALELSKGEDGNWQLSRTHRDQLGQDIATLETLLAPPSEQELQDWVVSKGVLTPEILPYVSREEMRGALVGGLAWELRGEDWIAPNIVISVDHEQPDETVPLGHLTTNLSVSTGEFRINPPQNISPLRTGLRNLQQESADAIRDYVTGDLATVVHGVVVLPSPPLTGLVGNWTISFSVPGKLRTRTVESNWNIKELDFEPALDAEDNDAFDRFEIAYRQLTNTLVRHVRREQQDSPYDWLRHVYKDFSSDHLVELGLPREDAWELGVRPPWASANDSAKPLPLSVSISDGDVIINEPAYWPLIAEYATLAENGFDLTSRQELTKFAGDLARAGVGSTGVDSSVLAKFANLAGKLTTIVPHFQMDQVSVPEFASGQSPVLQIPVQVGFGFPVGSRDLSLETIQSLGEAIDELLGSGGPPAATCVLSLDSGNVAKGWSGLDDAARVLSGAVDKILELDDIASHLPARLKAERDIEDILQAGNSKTLTNAQAYELLTDIWKAKGLDTRGIPANLTGFVQQRQGEIRFEGKDKVYPTVFVEYFCGLNKTYAIVWSSGVKGQQEVVEGPALVNLMATADLANAAARGTTLGEKLLEPVFKAVPDAIQAGYEPGQEDLFKLSLGIVLAMDTFIPPNLPGLAVQTEPLVSMLTDANQNEAEEIEWRSLEDLGDPAKIHSGTFKLLSGLLSDKAPKDGLAGPRAWAWGAVLTARPQP